MALTFVASSDHCNILCCHSKTKYIKVMVNVEGPGEGGVERGISMRIDPKQ